MTKFIFLICVIYLVSINGFAQKKPFEDFDKAVKEERGGFSGNKEKLSKIFNTERIRLGDNFEGELWKYISNDIEKHYWLNSFVESVSYLHGNKPLPELAFQIRQNALRLLGDKSDEESLGRKVTLGRKQTIYYHNIGKIDSALEAKSSVEKIVRENPDVSIYIGAMTRLDKCIYSNLGSDTSFCEKEAQKPLDTIVSSGYINGIAINLPQPENPKKLKGEVHIKVLISENGDVITAEPIKGNKDLFEFAIETAKKAKFQPLILKGKPTKRSGILVYKF